MSDIHDASFKDDSASMEHPLFALRAGDRRERFYGRNGYSVTVSPTTKGCATIHDKDLWIYCISQLVAAKNAGRAISRTVRFTMHDCLKSTNRDISGRAYERASNALERLSGTRITTNIETANRRERQGFGLVDAWRVIERNPDNQRMVAIEVELPSWLFRAIDSMQVLTLHRDYFRLRKPLDRRIYELARKHCGDQPRWRVGVRTLHEKSGSAAPLRKFRYDLRKLAATNELPGYSLTFDTKADAVTFYAKAEKGYQAQITDALGDTKGH